MSGTKATKGRAMRRKLLGDTYVENRDLHVADSEKWLGPKTMQAAPPARRRLVEEEHQF